MIDDLLDVSRIITGQLRLDVSEVNLIRLFRARLKLYVGRERQENPDSLRVCSGALPGVGDAVRCAQVVWKPARQRSEVYAPRREY